MVIYKLILSPQKKTRISLLKQINEWLFIFFRVFPSLVKFEKSLNEVDLGNLVQTF